MGVLNSSDEEDDDISSLIPSASRPRRNKKKNLRLFFGHENWNLMMNMLIGFRSGLKKLLYKESLIAEDFKQIVRHDISNVTFSSKFNSDNKFLMYEFAPYVFSKVRSLLGIDDRTYLKSIGPENILGNLLLGDLHTMTELISEGKSGSLFYLTHDNHFFVKTIRADEFNTAVRMI